MDYELTWADGADQRSRRLVAIKSALTTPFAIESNADVTAILAAQRGAMEALGGFLYVSGPQMLALIHEMDAQNMLAEVPNVAEKLEMQSGSITVPELELMLAGLEEDERIWPSSPLPHLEDASPAEIRMAQFDAEQQTDYVSANELLLRLSRRSGRSSGPRWDRVSPRRLQQRRSGTRVGVRGMSGAQRTGAEAGNG